MLTVIISLVGRRARRRSATVGSAVSSSRSPRRGASLSHQPLARCGEDDGLAADREVAALRPADVVLGHQDPAQVRVAAEHDPEEVEGLALLEVGGREELDAGVDLRQRVARPGSASIALTRRRSTAVAVQQLVVDAEARLGRQVVGDVQAGEEAVALAGVSRSQVEHGEDLRRGRRSAPPGRGRRRCRGPRRGGRARFRRAISSSPGASGTEQLPRLLVGLRAASALGLRWRGPPRAHSSVPAAL